MDNTAQLRPLVMGTDFVLTGSYSMTAAVASLVPFFLVNDLLLLTPFPQFFNLDAFAAQALPDWW